MIKAIFSDLDATLLSDDQTICQKNLDAIKKARELGVKFLFCTGRLPFCYTDYDYLGLKDYISTNGEIIVKDNKIVKKIYLDREAKTKIIKYAMEHNVYARIFAIDFLYLLNNDKAPFGNIYKDSKPIDYDEAQNIIDNIDLCKITFMSDKHEYLENIQNDIKKMNLNVDTHFSASFHLECIVKGESKAKGIKIYLEQEGIDIKEAISIGDNGNDISMLKATGIAACPSNAIAEVKQICDYVSPLNNNEGAVGDIIEKYVLNNR